MTALAAVSLLLLLAGGATVEASPDDEASPSRPPPRCRLYLAPASNPAAASSPLDPAGRLGVYTSIPLPVGTPLDLPDVVLNLPDVDTNWRYRMLREHGVQWTDAGLTGPLSSPGGSGLGPALSRHVRPAPSIYHARYDAEDVNSLAPGFASLARRAKDGVGSGRGVVRGVRPKVDGAGVHRRDNAPGAGAFSSYHDHDHVVTAAAPPGGGDNHGDEEGTIPAGAELFAETFPGARASADAAGWRVKSPEWLEENGLCLDHLRPGPSSVDQAGRGAFATRHLTEGEVVAPVPVVPVNREAMGRYHRDHADGPITFMGDMLLRNYCYGHPDSNVLLLPLGPAVNLINHADGGRVDDGKGGAEAGADKPKPNVELRWSSSSASIIGGGTGGWFDRSAEDVLGWSPDDEKNNAAAAPFPALELIALRNILPDEEIYLDYGPHWSSAWDRHVEDYNAGRKPILHAEKHVPPETLNADRNSLLKYGEELADDPPPANVVMTCRVSDDIGKRVAFRGKFGQERMWVDVGVTRNDTSFWTTDKQVRQCAMLGLDDDDDDDDATGEEKKYYVLVDFSVLGEDAGGSEEYIVRGVPRRAVEFANGYYSGDQYLARAFRHEIGLPLTGDGVFPAAWMDVKFAREARKKPDYDTCGLYMAESSIPNSGLGMYTATEIPLGKPIHHPEVVLQHYEHDGNAELRHRAHRHFRDNNEPAWLLYTYYWESRISRGRFETADGDETITMVPGLGMLANSHTGLVNALFRKPDVDSAGLHRSRDPGAGAFSEFHNYRYEAVSLHPDESMHHPIPAGMELFVEYGDDWFADREHLFGPVPLSYDFANADQLLERFIRMTDDFRRHTSNMKADELEKDLWAITKNMVDWSARMDIAMPEKLEDVRRYREVGTAVSSVPDVIRSPEWLSEHGRCMDNIREGPSALIPQAGRGAFATRYLPGGTVIAPAPVAHIHRRHLEVYELNSDDDEPYLDAHQMLLNYCYGHPYSSLLLFPYSPVVNLINSAPPGVNPNAVVRWSSMPSHKSDWIDTKSVEELMREEYAGLVMEFVALRNIQEGEEVLIDYGVKWADAWEEHIDSWEPVENADDYISASDLNAQGGPLRTEEEQEEDPYPPNVLTTCYVSKDITASDDTKNDRGPHRWFSEDRLVDYSDYATQCVLLERDDTDNAFSSSVRPHDDVYKARVRHWEYDNRALIVEGLPRSAVELVDAPYTRDTFLGNVFRHEIHVPGGMFPRRWMDLLDDFYDDRNNDEGEGESNMDDDDDNDSTDHMVDNMVKRQQAKMSGEEL